MILSAFDWAVVISLQRRNDRWLRTRQQLELYGINAERFPAVDGRTLQVNSLPIRWRFRNPPRRGSLGCFLSHLALLRTIEREHIPSTLILEDDVILSDNFAQVFGCYWECTPASWDLIYLGQRGFLPRKDLPPIRAKLPNNESANIYTAQWSQSCYGLAVSYHAAKTLLRGLEMIEKPIDLQIADMHSGLAVYVYTPPIILHADDADSTINNTEIIIPG